MAESFFAALKKGHIFWQHYRMKDDAQRSIFEYLEGLLHLVPNVHVGNANS